VKSTKSVWIFTKGRTALAIMSVLTILASFTSTQTVFGAELPIGTVSVCEENASAGLHKNNGNWQATEFAKKTHIFKKVPLEGARDRNRYSGCPTDLRGEVDSYWDDGTPEMLHRCYQFKTTGATKPIERGCYEVYGNGGDLININCEWGFVFHPEKELFKFPNYAIFQVNQEFAPTSFSVSHGTCSKM
jgi:hypothetical protein